MYCTYYINQLVIKYLENSDLEISSRLIKSENTIYMIKYLGYSKYAKTLFEPSKEFRKFYHYSISRHKKSSRKMIYLYMLYLLDLVRILEYKKV